jgi:ribosomal protein S18 acetylase RimI-like enzyme
MIKISFAKTDEMERAKKFIFSIFPSSLVKLNSDDFLILAKRDSKIIGFLHATSMDKKILLHGFGVDPQFRREGVGSMLLEFFLMRFGSSSIFLKVKNLNPAADLYLKHGFFLKKYSDSIHILAKQPNT